MSLYSRVIKGASILAVSQLVVAACTFLRNIIIARHITTEDYGIATTFAVTVSLVEMTSNLALDRILVQDRDGDSAEMLASSHMMQFVKGVIIGLILFMTAGPVARLFGLYELIEAFEILAVIPVIHGLLNFDLVVRQRKMEFAATALNDSIPQIISVVIAYAGSVYLKDHRVMLVVMIANASFQMIISHLLAKQPYRWAFKPELMRKKLDFGWPLLVNGILLFGIFQGDRVIIGTMYDMETLGWYSVAFSLCLLPMLIFSKMSGYVFMPILSRSRENPIFYLKCCRISMASSFCFASIMLSFFAVAGGALISVTYGDRYLEAAGIILWMAILQGLRIVRTAPTIIANSQAKTKNGLYSNLLRSTALILALLFALNEKSIMWIVVSGIIGEVLALMFSVYLVDLGDFKKRFVMSFIRLSFVFIGISSPIVYFQLKHTNLIGQDNIILQLLLGGAAAILSALLLAFTDPVLREEIRLLIKNVRERERPKRGIELQEQ